MSIYIFKLKCTKNFRGTFFQFYCLKLYIIFIDDIAKVWTVLSLPPEHKIWKVQSLSKHHKNLNGTEYAKRTYKSERYWVCYKNINIWTVLSLPQRHIQIWTYWVCQINKQIWTVRRLLKEHKNLIVTEIAKRKEKSQRQRYWIC